jgi:hypothetical protein
VLYGRLLYKNGHRCEPLTDFSYPIVSLQGGESRGDCFIECLGRDLYGVLNVSDIFYRNCARSKNHTRERSIFAFCSPTSEPPADGGFVFRILRLEVAFQEAFLPRDDHDGNEAGERCQSHEQPQVVQP